MPLDTKYVKISPWQPLYLLLGKVVSKTSFIRRKVAPRSLATAKAETKNYPNSF